MRFMVAFASPKRSAKTVEVAANHAKALGAELFLLRVVPDPKKVGVIAQLIASDRPAEKGQLQVDQVVERLRSEGVDASGAVAMGEVADTIIQEAKERQIDLLFLGTSEVSPGWFFQWETDKVAEYIVHRCPINVCLVRSKHDPNVDLDS